MFPFFKRKPKQPVVAVASTPPPPPPPLRCVARTILEDLDVKNADKWKIHYNEYHATACMDGKDYALQISYNNRYGWTPYHSVYLSGIELYSFTENEVDAIYQKYQELVDFQFNQKRQKTLQEEQETMKKWFPNCFKDNP
jgi:hypothetical protein